MNELEKFDREYNCIIAGVDEAGRGPLAGPVVAAAVIIDKYIDELSEINDSKKLTEKKREKLYRIIMDNCKVGIGMADVEEIDNINILNATFLSMRRALEKINGYELVLVDGNHKIREYIGKQESVIKGDGNSLAIAAASIIAKVYRDNIMRELSKEFPNYRLEKHKGYGTKLHRELILQYGPSIIHRKTFLKKILDK